MTTIPEFTPEDFRNSAFLRVRRQVARLRLLTAADTRLVAALREMIAIYDECLDDPRLPFTNSP